MFTESSICAKLIYNSPLIWRYSDTSDVKTSPMPKGERRKYLHKRKSRNMIEISRGNASQFDEIIDFIDYVFSKASRPHDFPTMYPALYRRTDESMYNTINLREDGIIKASLLCHPRTLSISGQELKINGIGSVATHPRERRRGFMTSIMNYCIEDMKSQGVHLSVLGGNRARYNHYGYEIGGNRYRIELSKRAFGNAKPDYDASEYEFVTVFAKDFELIDGIHRIYSDKNVHYIYDKEEFYLRMARENTDLPYAVYLDGELQGYIAYRSSQDQIEAMEICLKDDKKTCDTLFSLLSQKNKGISCRFGQWQLDDFKEIVDISDGEMTFTNTGMWNVLRWKEVATILLAHKASFTELEVGSLVLGFDEGVLEFSYDGVETRVEMSEKDVDFDLTGLKATRALLGSCPEAVFGNLKDNKKRTLLRSWFPLPLTWLSTESV